MRKKEYKTMRIEKHIWLKLQKLKFQMMGNLEKPVSLGDVIEMLVETGIHEDKLYEKRRKKTKGK